MKGDLNRYFKAAKNRREFENELYKQNLSNIKQGDWVWYYYGKDPKDTSCGAEVIGTCEKCLNTYLLLRSKIGQGPSILSQSSYVIMVNRKSLCRVKHITDEQIKLYNVPESKYPVPESSKTH